MNVKKHLACISMLALIACSSSDEEPIDQPQIPVRFSVCLNKEVLPFAETRSIPPFNTSEPIAKGGEEGDGATEIEDLCSRIDYIVYETGKELPYKEKRFTPEDEDFGIIYDSLPAGNYTVAILAHSSSSVTLSNKIMQFNDLSDTFHANKELEINLQSTISEDIILKRIVGKIEFMSTEPVTEELKSFHMKVNYRHPNVHVITGKGEPETEEKSFIHEFSTEEIGVSNLIFGFLTFIPPAESTTLEVDLFSTNKSGAISKERKVSSIKPIANRIIRYSGLLYTYPDSEVTLTLSVLNDGQWDGTDETELPD